MPLNRLIDFFHTLTPESVGRLPELYSADAYFKDPFNEVRGAEAVQTIFAHMFRQVDAPRFAIIDQVVEANGVMLVWQLSYRARRWGHGKTELIRGVSHIKFDPDGKVNYHRDYWDAAEELYMKLPVIGRLMLGLQRILSATK